MRNAFLNLPEYIPIFETVPDHLDDTWEEEGFDELNENEEELDGTYFSEEFSYRFEFSEDPEEKVIWNPIFHSV